MPPRRAAASRAASKMKGESPSKGKETSASTVKKSKAATAKTTVTKKSTGKSTAAASTATKKSAKSASSAKSAATKKAKAQPAGAAAKAPGKATTATAAAKKSKAASTAAGRRLAKRAAPEKTDETDGTDETEEEESADEQAVKERDTKKKASEAASKTTSTADKKKAPAGGAASRKRKAADDAQPPAKKARLVKKGPVINEVPITKLDVFVYGEGSGGELGLGSAGNVLDVKRPRLNPNLAADKVGVVQVAVGGMHCAALTHDNKIYTWGVNDQGALGRNTTWDGGMRDIDADENSEDENDSGLNPLESTPMTIPAESFPEGTIFTQLACGDSTTFAVTDDGQVWGWGTFRSNDGIMGFTATSFVQTTPMLIPELKAVKQIATGSNHALALTAKGKVFAWGCGQQNQLGRRVVERTRTNGLKPREVAIARRKLTHVACGAYHSFALDETNDVWAWGLNSFGETGISAGAGENAAVVAAPTRVEKLQDRELVALKGGEHHSIAQTREGDCLVWGRLDGCQTGIKVADLPAASIVRDEADRPRILSVPTAVPGLQARAVSAAGDSSLLVTPAGQAYSWGFSGNYQTGQGTDEDVEVAALVDAKSVRGRALNWAALGGQFGVLTAPTAAE